jgi:hypothetical protein
MKYWASSLLVWGPLDALVARSRRARGCPTVREDEREVISKMES